MLNPGAQAFFQQGNPGGSQASDPIQQMIVSARNAQRITPQGPLAEVHAGDSLAAAGVWFQDTPWGPVC